MIYDMILDLRSVFGVKVGLLRTELMPELWLGLWLRFRVKVTAGVGAIIRVIRDGYV